MRIILAILLLCPVAFGQWEAEDSLHCDTTDISLDAITWDDIWVAQDDPKPKCPNFVEIFYTDTVGWYLDTTTVQISCPDPNYSWGCAVMHWDNKIKWKPKVETISIFKFEPSTFEHFERWRIRRQ